MKEDQSRYKSLQSSHHPVGSLYGIASPRYSTPSCAIMLPTPLSTTLPSYCQQAIPLFFARPLFLFPLSLLPMLPILITRLHSLLLMCPYHHNLLSQAELLHYLCHFYFCFAPRHSASCILFSSLLSELSCTSSIQLPIWSYDEVD